jgi:hypothetical protein
MGLFPGDACLPLAFQRRAIAQAEQCKARQSARV